MVHANRLGSAHHTWVHGNAASKREQILRGQGDGDQSSRVASHGTGAHGGGAHSTSAGAPGAGGQRVRAAANPAECSRLTTSTAMAGDAASPGESTPAAWTNAGAVLDTSMIQSPVDVLARAPANEWITSPASKPGTSSRDFCTSSAVMSLLLCAMCSDSRPKACSRRPSPRTPYARTLLLSPLRRLVAQHALLLEKKTAEAPAPASPVVSDSPWACFGGRRGKVCGLEPFTGDAFNTPLLNALLASAWGNRACLPLGPREVRSPQVLSNPMPGTAATPESKSKAKKHHRSSSGDS